MEFQPSLLGELLCSNTEAFKAPLLEGSAAFLPFQKSLRAGNAVQWASEWAISGTEQNLALSKATKSSSGWGFFFLCTDCVFQIWNWLSSRPDLMTHTAWLSGLNNRHVVMQIKIILGLELARAKQCHSWFTIIWISPKFTAEVSSNVGCTAFGELTTATALWPKKWLFNYHCSCWKVQSHGKHPEGLFWACFFCSKQSSKLSPTWITQMNFLYSPKNILREPESSEFPILTLLQHKPATLSQMLWPFSCNIFCFFAKADRLDIDWWKTKWTL